MAAVEEGKQKQLNLPTEVRQSKKFNYCLDSHKWILDNFGSGRFADVFADTQLFAWIHECPRGAAEIESRVAPVIQQLIPVLAEKLVSKLDVFISDGTLAFRSELMSELNQLRKGSNSAEMLSFVGFLYATEAEKKSANPIEGLCARVETQHAKFAIQCEMAAAFTHMRSHALKLHDFEKEKIKEKQKAQKALVKQIQQRQREKAKKQKQKEADDSIEFVHLGPSFNPRESLPAVSADNSQQRKTAKNKSDDKQVARKASEQYLRWRLNRLAKQTYKNLCKQQIEKLIRSVCDLVLTDKKVLDRHRKLRAKALKLMGEMFLQASHRSSMKFCHEEVQQKLVVLHPVQ